MSLVLGACTTSDADSTVSGPTVAGQPNALALYRANCARCHGSTGGGGFGPQLSDGEVALTFPDPAEELAWIRDGSRGKKGEFYGDPNRPGGQREVKKGTMPGFPKLTDAEIAAISAYTRSL
jgi:mono/diheme cytochrome c family protein